MDDAEKDEDFKKFLVTYAWDIMVMMVVSFWHIFFLISMGTGTSLLIFQKMKGYNDKYSGSEIPINYGWKVLLFGLLYGAADYMAGLALSVNKETILKMVGFSADLENEGSAYLTTVIGGITTTINISQDEERKKNFFELYEVMENWNLLFLSQRALQIILPYVYIGMLEVTVFMVFLFTLYFY